MTRNRSRLPDEILVMVHMGQAHKYQLTTRMSNILSDPGYTIPHSVVLLSTQDLTALREHWENVDGSVKGRATWVRHASSIIEEHMANQAKNFYHLAYQEAIGQIDLSSAGIFLKGELLGYKLPGTTCESISTKVNDLLRNNCKKLEEEPKYEQKYNANFYSKYASDNSTTGTGIWSPDDFIRLMGKVKLKPFTFIDEAAEIEE